jgi:F-type H+-transporting ATPase subunit b
MISINATLLIQLIHFLLLLFIMNRLMLQPLLKVIREREAYTENTKSEIKDIEVKIGQLKEQFIAKENGARKDAAQERTDIMSVGMNEADGFLNKSREEVSSIRQQAEKEVEAEVSKTQPLLADQASSLVSGIMEKIIGRRIEA